MSKETSLEIGEEVSAGDELNRYLGDLDAEPELHFPTDSFIQGAIKDHWGDSSKLLFQAGYVQVLKQMALSGQLQQYNIRSVCWKLFLGCLPEDQRQWEEAVGKSRDHYTQLKKKYIIDPHSVEVSLDVTLNNPLSLAEDSPWNQFFQDNDLKQLIKQDVVRTFPDVQFFKQQDIQETMLDILFCYAREHDDLGYRQGMHELLAPVLFVLHAETRDPDDNSVAPIVKTVMNQNYIEHDAYTIFSELMESMQAWYQSSALEADYYRQKSMNNNKKMALDPRTHKPFRDENEFTPTSAITRKLDKIHTLLLKNADEVLHEKLKELAIPSQTYGIRWIRLLFGREFPLPSVLEMWDALFADGPSLGLMDYIFVAMLMHIREVLIEGEYALCMQHLMHFPPVYEVNYLVQRALHLRNPAMFPSPQWWTYHPSRNPTSRHQPSMVPIPSSAHPLSPTSELSTGLSGSIQESSGSSSFQTKASKAKQALSKPILKALSRPTRAQTGPRLEFHSPSSSTNREARSRSPSPRPSRRHTELSPLDEDLFTDPQIPDGGGGRGAGGGAKKLGRGGKFKEEDLFSDPVFSSSGKDTLDSGKGGTKKPSRIGRFKIIGDSKKSTSLDRGEEMRYNPRSRPLYDEAFSDSEKLINRIDDLEAKCLYCGGKMDTLICTLQEEITQLEGLADETENTLLLSLAGLKHVRDLLLNKIPFSGEYSPTLAAKPVLGSKDNSEEGSSTDLLTSSDKIIDEATNNGEDVTRTDPISTTTAVTPDVNVSSVTTNNSSSTVKPAGADKDVSMHPLGHLDSKLKEETGGVVAGNSVPGGPEEDWVNLSLSPNHPLQGKNHPLQNSGSHDQK